MVVVVPGELVALHLKVLCILTSCLSVVVSICWCEGKVTVTLPCECEGEYSEHS